MHIYLVQHGISVAKNLDPDRPLSEEGKADTERMANNLKKTGISINRIFHSGKTRARQTAEIFAAYMATDNVSQADGMNPNDNALAFAAELDTSDVMYVGHLPQLSHLVSFLTTGNEDINVLQFTNSAVACLEKTESGFHIAWYLTPGICKE